MDSVIIIKLKIIAHEGGGAEGNCEIRANLFMSLLFTETFKQRGVYPVPQTLDK